MLDGQQHVGEAAEHEGADSLALESAGAGPHELALGGRDAEMVRPETDQSFDKAGCGTERLVETGLRFIPIDVGLDRRHA